MRGREPTRAGATASSSPHDGARAQTTIDFTAGTVVFLLAAGSVLAAVPSMIDPAVSRGPAKAVVADRTADRLVHDVFAAPGEPYVLNESATRARFENEAVRERLSLPDDVQLNVTLTGGGERLTVGPAPPERRGSVYPARRVVTMDGEHRVLRVRVW
ncbi:MAG: hypothetical protein ABEJ05_12110 [Haloglomus sp.]